MRLQFILSEIGIGLRRNLSMSISVILVTFVSLTFVGAVGALFTTFFFIIPAPVVGAAQSAAHLLFG